MPEKKRNLGIRASDDRWKVLNHLATDLDTSVQGIVDLALDRYIAGSAGSIPMPTKVDIAKPRPAVVQSQTSVPETPQESQWIQRLLTVLRSHHDVAIAAVTSSLAASWELIDVRAGGDSTTKRAEADKRREVAELGRKADIIGPDKEDTRKTGEGVG